MPDGHARSGVAHHGSDARAHVGLEAVDGASGTGGLLIPEGASFDAPAGVVEELGAVPAEAIPVASGVCLRGRQRRSSKASSVALTALGWPALQYMRIITSMVRCSLRTRRDAGLEELIRYTSEIVGAGSGRLLKLSPSGEGPAQA